MKTIKLDGRYRHYPEFEQALYFPLREHQMFGQILDWCYRQYGVSEQWKSDHDGIRYVVNPMWRFDKKKRRIYLKNPADISMALLTLQNTL